jgi:hypothetical protein
MESELPQPEEISPPGDKIIPCGRCELSGRIQYSDRYDKLYIEECPLCGGSGFIVLMVMPDE